MCERSVVRFVLAIGATVAAVSLGRGVLVAQQPAPPPGGSGNQPPHADAGPNRKLGLYPGRFITITLDGSKSYDPDFDVITYVWRNNSTGTIVGTGPIATDRADSVGQYSYTLTVTDTSNARASSTTVIDVVQDVLPPVVSAPEITVGRTEDGGARGSASSALAAYESGGKTSAVDNVDAHPAFVDVRVGNTLADSSTFFPLGPTTIRVTYQDTAGNVGFADSVVNVVDHQDNDTFVVADNPHGGSIVIVRVRGSQSEAFCSPTQYVPFSEAVPVIVDSEGRVVFLGYLGDSIGRSWALFRCSVPGAPPEVIAQFRNGDALLYPDLPEAFPGEHFTNIGSLHLESVRSVTFNGGNPQVITEDAYVMAARPKPGPHVEAIRYRTKTGVWEDGRTVPEPIQGDVLPPMVSHGGATYSSDGQTIRKTSIPLQVNVSGTIGGTDFSLSLALFGGVREIPKVLGGTIIDDVTIPNVESFCPDGKPNGLVMPMPPSGPGFHVLDAISGLFYDEFNGHGLIATSNEAVTFGAAGTIFQELLDDDASNDKTYDFFNPFTGCSLVHPVVGTSVLLPSFDPVTGVPNDVPPIASAPNGLYAVVGRSPILVGVIDGLRLHVTATLPYFGLPRSIAAFPAATPAPSGTQIYIEVDSPVDVMATDPNGKRLGVLNGEPVNDFGADGFDSGPGEPRVFVIRNPVSGRFTMQSIGTGEGPFAVHVYSVDLDKPFGTHVKVSGTASPGSGGSHDFELGVDGGIRFVNLSPVANAGTDQTVDADANGVATIVLDGSQSSDPDGDSLHFTWAGPFGNVTGPHPQVIVPIGVHVVTLTVDDGKDGSSSATVTITVKGSKADTTPPTLTLPPNQTVEAIGAAGVPVNFATTANDAVDGPVPVNCTPVSGATFGLGSTIVNCTASDLAGNVTHGSFTVTVADTVPPVLTLPANQVVEATGPSGAAAPFTATANDLVDGSRSVACTPASGSLFPLGTTTVGCTTSDSSGNTVGGPFTITVRDTTPPTLTLPASLALEATNPAGAVATFSVVARDAVDGSPTVSCAPASGSLLALGTTTVACTGADARGNLSRGSFAVVVRDTTPPQIAVATPATGATYAINQKVPSSYGCSDGGSGIATCAGTVANGRNIDTSAAGPKTFVVNAADVAGNATTKTITYQVVCHYVTVVPSPSTVAQGGLTMVNATVSSCGASSQVVSLTFALTGPIASRSCGTIKTDVFTTPPFTLPSNTHRSVSFPFRVPDQTCAGTYSLTATTSVGGKPVDASTTPFTVTPR